MAEQLESFPCLVREFKQFDGKPGRGRAIGEDEVEYFVKCNRDRPVCAIEWICTSLADSLNIPVPKRRVMKMPNGDLVFGSQSIGDALPDHELGQILQSGVIPNGLSVGDMKGLLARILAFDLFIGNHDRHFGNYLFALQHSVDGTTRTGVLNAFDFESADVLTREKIRLPMNGTSQTVRDGRIIQKAFAFDLRAASQTLTLLRKGREFMFERAMYGLPEEWLSARQRTDLLGRVRSASFEAEIMQLEQGLGDGSYR